MYITSLGLDLHKIVLTTNKTDLLNFDRPVKNYSFWRNLWDILSKESLCSLGFNSSHNKLFIPQRFPILVEIKKYQGVFPLF